MECDANTVGRRPLDGEAGRMAADVARYGPDIQTEAEFNLLGNLEGKRVLELGSAVQASIAFTKQGAHVIAVDTSAERLADLRRRADEEEVKIELHESDLADIAFVRADSIDAVRCAKLALDRGVGGALLGPSAYFMKSPPVQYPDDQAREMVEEFGRNQA